MKQRREIKTYDRIVEILAVLLLETIHSTKATGPPSACWAPLVPPKSQFYWQSLICAPILIYFHSFVSYFPFATALPFLLSWVACPGLPDRPDGLNKGSHEKRPKSQKKRRNLQLLRKYNYNYIKQKKYYKNIISCFYILIQKIIYRKQSLRSLLKKINKNNLTFTPSIRHDQKKTTRWTEVDR